MKLTIADLDAEIGVDEQKPFTIELDGEEITLPSARDIPTSLLIGLGKASEMEIAARVLGTDEWQRIMRHPSMNLARLQVLSEKYYAYLREAGLGDLGKARALPR